MSFLAFIRLAVVYVFLSVANGMDHTPTCTNVLPGYSSSNKLAEFCCPLGCGYCGGVGCGSSGEEFGLVGLDCCQSGIFSTQIFCNENTTAPCIIESYTETGNQATIDQEDRGITSSAIRKYHKSSVISGIMVVSVFLWNLLQK